MCSVRQCISVELLSQVRRPCLTRKAIWICKGAEKVPVIFIPKHISSSAKQVTCSLFLTNSTEKQQETTPWCSKWKVTQKARPWGLEGVTASLLGLCSPCLCLQMNCQASPGSHPSWGLEQGSESSHAAVWESLGWHEPLARFRPVISSDFDLMQQLLVMWFEGDKCPV